MDTEIVIGFMELEGAIAGIIDNVGRAPLFPAGPIQGHPTVGDAEVTDEDLQAMADAINQASGDLVIDYDHSAYHGKGSLAAGWIKPGTATVADGFLWGSVEWTPQAAEQIRTGQYRYISPEWNFDGKKNGRMVGAILKAATLTNRPFFKNMPPAVASELELADIVEFDHELEGGHIAASKKPYGNVTYADPGYQSDGKARYPIDTEDHIRAAWSYINQSKNAGKYKPGQVSRIKSKIRSAMKRVGAQVADDMDDEEVTAMLAAVPLGAMNAEPDADDQPASPRRTKGDEMDPKELASLLGLAEDASADEIKTAIADARAKATAVGETPPGDDGGDDDPPPDDSKTAVAMVAEVRREIHEERKAALLDAAVADLRILPAEREFFAGQYDSNPDAVKAHLASLTPREKGPIGTNQDLDETEAQLAVAAADDFGTTVEGSYIPVEPNSYKLHVAALGILEESGKGMEYTAEEYVNAVKIAERKTGIGSVHMAMRPRHQSTHVAA